MTAKPRAKVGRAHDAPRGSPVRAERPLPRERELARGLAIGAEGRGFGRSAAARRRRLLSMGERMRTALKLRGAG
jgi:hypothetical protein